MPEHDQRLDRGLLAVLPGIAIGGAFIFIGLALLNFGFRPAEHRLALVGSNLLCATIAFTLWWMARSGRLRPEHAHPATFVIQLSALGGILVGFLATNEPNSIGYLSVVVMAAGVLMTSPRWFVAALIASASTLAILLAAPGPAVPSKDEFFILFAGLGVAVVTFRAHRATFVQLHEATVAAERARHLERERTRMLEEFIANAPVGIYRTTRNGRVLLANPALEAISGYQLEELKRINLNQKSASQYNRAEFLARLDAEGSIQGMEATWIRKDGGAVHVRESARLVRDVEGAEYIEGIVEDVTQWHEARELLQRQERLSALGTLVAGVAHEINNPLTYLRGSVELAQLTISEWAAGTEAPTPAALEECAELHERTLAGLDRIEFIVKGLRLVARVPTGDRRRQPINDIVAGAVPIVQGHLPPHVKVSLQLDSREQLVVNEHQLSQCVLNLVLNAVEAAQETAEGRVHVRTFDEAGRTVVEVSDNGAGIPPDVQGRLFTPFMTMKPNGTGLGLAICQQIVQAHQGAIVFTTGATGTVFQARLPHA